MKKNLALVLAVVFIIALFAGCGGQSGTSAPAATTSGTSTSSPANTATNTDEGTSQPVDAEPVDEGPYKFAAGKFEKDERGIALTQYDYDVPFCTTDEILTYWTTNWTPQLISEEGFSSMAYPQMIKDHTGVNVEWIIASANSRSEQYSVLLAADDLCDMMGCAFSFHPGTVLSAIEDGYYANLYDYIDYMPNYTYQIVRWDYDKDVLNRIFYAKDIIACVYGMINDPVPRMGYGIRGDILDRVGLKAEDLDTYSEIHDALLAIKTAGISDYPMDINKNVEMDYGIFAGGMGTYLYNTGLSLPLSRVVDGKAMISCTQEDDRKAMALISSWYADGLINPNWASVADSTDLESRLASDESCYCFMTPTGIDQLELTNQNPDCRWDQCVRPRENSGDYIKLGTKISKFSFGNTGVSAKCENIPLAVSWCDWTYSAEGSFKVSYGIEGLTYDFDENGKVYLTDFTMKHESGTTMSWILATFALNALCDHGLLHNFRTNAYPGGERSLSWMVNWTEKSGEKVYDWPASCKFTDDETDELNSIKGDLITYITENWTAFVDGSRPMSDWDDYVQGCYNVGLGRVEELYQASYDRYLAS